MQLLCRFVFQFIHSYNLICKINSLVTVIVCSNLCCHPSTKQKNNAINTTNTDQTLEWRKALCSTYLSILNYIITNLQPQISPQISETFLRFFHYTVLVGVILILDPMQTENDPLALDGDVSAQFYNPLLLVMSAVQVDTNFAKHFLNGITNINILQFVSFSVFAPISTFSFEIFSHCLFTCLSLSENANKWKVNKVNLLTNFRYIEMEFFIIYSSLLSFDWLLESRQNKQFWRNMKMQTGSTVVRKIYFEVVFFLICN